MRGRRRAACRRERAGSTSRSRAGGSRGTPGRSRTGSRRRGSRRRSAREELLELVRVREAHDTLDLAAAVEPDRRRVDDAEEAVAAADEPEEVGVLVREQVRATPSGPTTTRLSMSETNGPYVRPRPCTFADTAPPMQRSSAPVCFWRIAHGVSASASTSAGHWIPASTSTRPFSSSIERTRDSGRVSSTTPPEQNCCPPIACRPPAIETGRRLAWAKSSAVPIDSSESTGTTASTSVSLSREWTSLTTLIGP